MKQPEANLQLDVYKRQNLNGVDSYIQQMVKGLIIAVAVVFDIRSKNRKTRKIILVENSEKKEAK